MKYAVLRDGHLTTPGHRFLYFGTEKDNWVEPRLRAPWRETIDEAYLFPTLLDAVRTANSMVLAGDLGVLIVAVHEETVTSRRVALP